ncbi:hypothetical protein [Amycolatopsis sacchari]|uniref:hypothetical protein n=1 Tax=Amycolatopsis sacchari TaxID=115433 RepID=UPI003EB966EE
MSKAVSDVAGPPEAADRLQEEVEAARATADFVRARAVRLQAEAARHRAEARRLVRHARAALSPAASTEDDSGQ